MTVNNGTLYDYQCSNGLILPLINEFTWSVEARAFLYLFGLFYCFVAISIISDIFMCSIEKITSQTRRVFISRSPDDPETDDGPEVVEIRIWSDTVANLTLMALGSSAPEILLSCIEVVSRRFEAGQLGPSTIVGSAAFNLFGIVSICIFCIPGTEIRKLKDVTVFSVTSIFSFIAYLWLLFILVISSPSVVEIWEAVITFALFPLMVILSWAAEKKFFHSKAFLNRKNEKHIELDGFVNKLPILNGDQNGTHSKLTRKTLAKFIKNVRKKDPNISDEEIAYLAAQRLIDNEHHSRLWYRINATRDLTGSTRRKHAFSPSVKEVYEYLQSGKDVEFSMDAYKPSRDIGSIIQFHCPTAKVMENIGTFDVTVVRTGNMAQKVQCRIESIDGTAIEGEDYVKVDQILTFEPNVSEIQVPVQIVNDNQYEPDEDFFLKLSLVVSDECDETDVASPAAAEAARVMIGKMSIMDITILNDDEPGKFQFKKRGYVVSETIGVLSVPVERVNGADGDVSVRWRSIDRSAIHTKDYIGGDGVITFKHTETEQNIDITILNDMIAEKDENFELELLDPAGGASIGRINRTTVTITSDENFNSTMSRLTALTMANWHSLSIHKESWGEQFHAAMSVNGGEDLSNASVCDYIGHFVTFFWKVLFAFVPPSSMLGGWPCFVVSISLIGVLTAVVGDFASIFGCLVGLSDSITAITLVALGTSLPDTFASRTAAIKEKYADFAIGNITGSNSVNVFLGLGLPWILASVYHTFNKSQFRVPAGDLTFSVSVYCVCAFICVLFLVLRRRLKVFGNGELGGPLVSRYFSSLLVLSLWFIYLVLSILKTSGFLDK